LVGGYFEEISLDNKNKMVKYKLIFINKEEKEISKAKINEKNRFVEEYVNTGEETREKRYNYYPFENLSAIYYIGED